MLNPSTFATPALCAGAVFAALACNGATATEADATDGAFACAKGARCNAATEFCQLNFASSSGPFGQCVPLPSACLSARSCTCIMAALSFQQCTGSYPVPCTDSSGQIVVTCAMP